MKDEDVTENCPLCGKKGEAIWCYPLTEAAGFNEQFNPVRLWLYCEDCHHIYAKYFPKKLFMLNDLPREANYQYFSMYSETLSRIRMYNINVRLLEVGIGAGECALTAREMGYDVFGIDVIERHVEDVRNKYGLNAETHDFIEFESAEKWDVIMMGDVLEHVSDPDLAIKKAAELLNENGVLWISTPNFDSAYSDLVNHSDPMRKQTYHINYFSRESLYNLLDKHDFAPVDYHISEHYSGSMEVIAIKE